jgi:hypothetical protein
MLAARRVLVMLDNARDTTQVIPLLPGGDTCAVLITSRNQLPGLTTAHGARPLPVDLLTPDEANALLVHRLGAGRIAAEPAAARALVDYCDGLPLALAGDPRRHGSRVAPRHARR